MKIEEAVTMIGTKFYQMKKENEYHVIRILSINQLKSKKDNVVFNTVREENGEKIYEDYYEKALAEWWTKLIPDGIVTFIVAGMKSGEENYEDVIVTTYLAKTLAEDNQKPDVILRQGVSDLMSNNGYVGMCISSEDVDDDSIYNELMYMTSIHHMYGINIYINDTIDDILTVLGEKELSIIDKVLETGFKDYINKSSGIDMGQKHTKGHCRDLRTLMEINNYAYAHDSAFHVLPVKFNLEDYLTHVNDEDNAMEYDVINSDLREELSYLFRKNISEAIALEYDHDIDLTKLPMDRILFIRGLNGKLWILRITYDGEFIEKMMDNAILQKYLEDIKIVRKYGSQNRQK